MARDYKKIKAWQRAEEQALLVYPQELQESKVVLTSLGEKSLMSNV